MANDYGIRFGNLFKKSEWKAVKKELQRLDEKKDNFEFTKADYKEIKAHIKAGDLGAYMDKLSDDMRSALGLSLTKKVDGSEDMLSMLKIVSDVNLAGADKTKVIKYIQKANVDEMVKNFNLSAFNDSCKSLENAATVAHIENPKGPFADLFV